MTQIDFKMLLATAALAALIATPASAASQNKRHHRIYPQTHATTFYRASPPPIYVQGHYLGTDPDPSVRFEIRRDPYFARR